MVLSKHQSAWETCFLPYCLPRQVCFVYKKELHLVPFFGWGLGLLGMIPIDREKGRDAFDQVVLYQDQCQRGRADGEVLALLHLGLKEAKRTKDIKEIHGEFLAIDTALETLKSGDLCLILVDQVEEALEHIAKRISEG